MTGEGLEVFQTHGIHLETTLVIYILTMNR